MTQMTYRFQDGKKEWNDLLGGKGANLCEMTNLGLPVPPGFIISTEACRDYLAEGREELSGSLLQEVEKRIEELEAVSNKTFGMGEDPLLVSVRSGAKFSMPGMMDTILNLGLNDETVLALAEITGNQDFAFQCYCRLIQMFADVVFDVDSKHFGSAPSSRPSLEEWQKTTAIYKETFSRETGREFPQTAFEQLTIAVQAVFSSWNNNRAKIYRSLHGIPDNLGTAVNIQMMVFGNYSSDSGTGVMFTRNPATGEKGVYGEYLLQAQGEDIVAGIRTPEPISTLQEALPAVYDELMAIADKLEHHYKDMQDVEFTIEAGKLYMLQTRNGKRTPKAAVAIVHDLLNEGMIDEATLIQRIEPEMIDQLLHPTFAEKALKASEAVAKGLPASPGAATGKVVFTSERAKELAEQGNKVILVRNETSPEDIEGMNSSEAIVTARGGMTSHAAVVARGMGVCCVVGCESLRVNEEEGIAHYTGGEMPEGTVISVDGSTGKIYLGEIPLNEEAVSEAFDEILAICDKHAKLQVYGNAETPRDIKEAVTKGAKGIGLARTEHMFFQKDRLKAMRQLILAGSTREVDEALAYIKGEQKGDFAEIFRILGELPCTVRLLDPPLHEFLPTEKGELREVAQELGKTEREVISKAQSLAEINPMLGLRGVRLGITQPKIYQMQVEAIMEAAIEVSQEKGITIAPHIMIPLVGTAGELSLAKADCIEAIEGVFTKTGKNLPYEIGTMIEIPRACFIADQLAETADFFSFGTNDLTQLTYGYSRDDAHKFLPAYTDKGILPADPFQHLDTEGVGELMRLAATNGKAAKPTLSVGVCGEVGGDPESIEFIQTLPVDYVSCSPFRIPQARLACAKAAVKLEQTTAKELVTN